MYGSDAFNALEPNEFKNFCKYLREALLINNSELNKNNYFWLKSTKKVFEKSIVLSKDITKNSKIKLSDLSFKKPGDGISASKYKNIIGKKIIKNLKKNHKLKIKDFI
jgi:sialic acid synthase SpsE